jgi:hypothetical protein
MNAALQSIQESKFSRLPAVNVTRACTRLTHQGEILFLLELRLRGCFSYLWKNEKNLIGFSILFPVLLHASTQLLNILVKNNPIQTKINYKI